MSLEMRAACEGCAAGLAPGDPAFICSYECTFCPGCTSRLGQRCPNCGGELVRRPRRAEDRPAEPGDWQPGPGRLPTA